MDPRQVLRERKVFQVLTVKIDLSLGQHTYFSPSNLGWKKANRIISSVPGFSVQWFLSTTATPALHGPWTSASTFLSLSLFSFRSWTVVSAWTGLSNLQRPRHTADTLKAFWSGVSKLGAITAVRHWERDSTSTAGTHHTVQSWHWGGLQRSSEAENLGGVWGKNTNRRQKENENEKNPYAG